MKSLLILGTIIAIGILLYHYDEFTKNMLRKLRDFFLPEDATATPEAFTKTQLRALSEKRTITNLLFYRSYMEDDESGLGIFKMHDGRAGIAFKVQPPVYLTENTENVILNVLSAIVNDDTIVHIDALAGRDVKDIVEKFGEVHQCENINIKHPQKLKDIMNAKKQSFIDWTTQSMMGDDADLRIRNFTHIISVLFPVGLERDKVIKQCNQIYGILKENLNAVIADDSDIVSYVAEVLNPSKQFYPRSEDPITTINKRMARGAVVQGDEKDGTLHLANGWHAKVLTTDKYPKQVDAFAYQGIFFDPLGADFQIKLPCPFHLSLTIRFSDVEKQRKKVLEKAKWNIGQLSGLPLIIEKKKPEIKERRKEAENVIQYINYLGEIPVDAAWSLTVYENNLNRLEQYTTLIKSSFDSFPGRWILREETFSNIAFYTMIMGLPLNYSEALHSVIDKFDKNFKSNNAQIAPLVGDFKGMGNNPVHMYAGRTGQIMPLDIFASKENYNIVVVGPMGTGKSFWTNNFLMSGIAAGWQVRMIDFGRSYLRANDAIGGQFLEFTKDADICLNFFTHLLTETIVENGEERTVIDPDEFESIVPIVGLMMGVSLKEIYKSSDSSSGEKLELSVMSTFVINAVSEVFKRHGHEGGMKEVGQILDEMRRDKLEENGGLVNDESEILSKMSTSLESYTMPNGPFYKYFNGVNNINLDSHFFTLELDDIATSPMMPVVAMSFLQRTAQEAFIGYLKDMNTSRIIGVDEAHKILGNEIFAKFFDDFGRRIRKYRGIPILITQSIEDFFVNPAATAFFELASFKIFLKQKMETIDGAARKGRISLNPFKRKLFNSISLKTPHYNEFLVRHLDTDFIGLLKVNSDEYWTYTTQPMDRAKIANVMQKYSVTTQDAIWLLARVQDGMSLDKALYELSKIASIEGKKDWDKFFRYVIENDAVFIAEQKVVYKKDKTEKIEFEELYMRVKGENGILHNPGMFMLAAQDKGYHYDISKRFVEKVYMYILKNTKNDFLYSINIDYFDIINEDFMQYLLLTIEKLDKNKNKLLIEIELNYETKENFETVLSFARKLKKIGVNIGFDNVILNQIDFKSLIYISPKFLKISSNEINELQEDELIAFKNFFVTATEAVGIKIIATKVESEEDMRTIEELGIHRFQGYFVHKTENILG